MIKVTAEIPASVWQVTVKVGQQVAAGDDLIILESMKMEIPVSAPSAGTIAVIHVAESDSVQEGQVLVEIEAGR